MTKADELLDKVYQKLGLTSSTDEVKYQNLTQINGELDAINKASSINVKTTGTITERLVELALRAYAPNQWYHLRQGRHDWLGDFAINAYPLSVVISVKSFKAKERLLVSGTGTLYAPTIGWGRFDDPTEFEPERLKVYLFRGFLAIYMPQNTIQNLKPKAQKMVNFYGRPFVRSLDDFGTDLRQAQNLALHPAGTQLINTASF